MHKGSWRKTNVLHGLLLGALAACASLKSRHAAQATGALVVRALAQRDSAPLGVTRVRLLSPELNYRTVLCVDTQAARPIVFADIPPGDYQLRVTSLARRERSVHVHVEPNHTDTLNVLLDWESRDLTDSVVTTARAEHSPCRTA